MENEKQEKSKHKKVYIKSSDGTEYGIYEQNRNHCTYVYFGFRIPKVDPPYEDELIGIYKNVVFYQSKDGAIRIPKKKPGIFHELEHDFFLSGKGKVIDPKTGKEKVVKIDVDDNNEFFARTNTVSNAQTSQNYVRFMFSCPSDKLEDVLKRFQAMLGRISFDHEQFVNESKVVAQELDMYLDEGADDRAISQFLNGESFDNLTISEILGIDRKVINSINEAQILKLMKNCFTRQNMIVTAVSDRPYEEVKKLIDTYLLAQVPSIPASKIYTKKYMSSFDSDEMITLEPNKEQKTAQIYFALKGTDNYDENEIFETIEDFVLNDFQGRLLKKLRCKDAKTYTPSFFSNNYEGGAVKYFSVQTTPENVSSCISILRDILHDIATNGITDKEFEMFKEMWQNKKSRVPSTKYESCEKMFDRILDNHKPFIGQYNTEISKLTKEDVNDYLKRTYSQALCRILISGNYNPDELQDLDDILQFRPYDKYDAENFFDKEGYDDFIAYVLNMPNRTSGEPIQIHYVGEEKMMEKKKDEKKKSKGKKGKSKKEKDTDEKESTKTKQESQEEIK